MFVFLSRFFLILVFIFMVSCSEEVSNSSSDEVVLKPFAFSGAVLGDYSENLMVLAQNQETQKVYVAEVDSSGNFSVELGVDEAKDNGDVFHISLIQESPFRYVGTGVKSYSSNAESAITGIEVREDLANVTLNYSLEHKNNDVVVIEEHKSIVFNDAFKARLSGDKPVGVDSVGKGDSAKSLTISSVNKLDPDEDGLPNMFDAMDDGKNLDNTRTSTRVSAVSGSAVATHASMFMNYKIDYTATASATVTNDALLTIEVLVSDHTRVSSIVADKVHANYHNSSTTQLPIGFTAIDTFPSEGSDWKDGGFKLYHATNMEGDHIWTVFIKPNNNAFMPGDLIRLKATLTDGTVEYYWVTTHFKFQSVATDTTNWIHGGQGSITNPKCILDTGGRVFTWTAPKDTLGNDLAGLDYAFELFYLENSNPTSVVHEGTPHMQLLERDSTGDSIAEADIDRYESASTTPNILQVDVKASYAYGDNAALKIYLARKKWGSSSSCPD